MPRISVRLITQTAAGAPLRLAIACALLVTIVAPARADQVERTSQAKAARAEFLLRAVAPGPPAAICLVDTGVNVNPDTAGVVARLSLPRLDGTDSSPTLHGTQMSMLIGGNSNGYGMVGLWPGARIVSVQANFPGQDVFPLGGHIAGIHRCDVESEVYGIKVIVITTSTAGVPSDDDAVLLADAVAGARNHGMNVVIAGGDNVGGPVGTPANAAGALSVSAADAGTGALCAGSSTGASMLAPGCSLDTAEPQTGQPAVGQQGTGAAAALVGTALAALRTWRPDLSPLAAEQLITGTGPETPNGRRLDVTATFEAAGLQSVVAPPAPPVQPAPAPAPAKQRLVKPRITVRSSGGGARRTLRIRTTNRPAKATLTVRVYRSAGKGKLRRIATKTVRSSKLTVRVSRRWTRVTAQFTDPTGARLPSHSAKVSGPR